MFILFDMLLFLLAFCMLPAFKRRLFPVLRMACEALILLFLFYTVGISILG
jgi:hypothetical protein